MPSKAETVLSIVGFVAGLGVGGGAFPFLAESEAHVLAALHAELDEGIAALDAGFAYEEDGQWDSADAEAQSARLHFAEGNRLTKAHRVELNANHASEAEFRFASMDRQAVTLIDMVAWGRAVEAYSSCLSGAPGVDQEQACLYRYEAVTRAGHRAADDWTELAGQLREYKAAHPLLAAALEIDDASIALLDDKAAGMRSIQDQLDADFASLRTLYAQGYVEERNVEPTQPRASLPRNLVSEDLELLFVGFDANRDGELDIDEAQSFYYWVEDNIAYRYDDENYRSPFAGYDVGDGRPGKDYQQTPTETFEERKGDCEDQNTLEVAFYQYWGITALQAYVNAEAANRIDHAIAIVYGGQTLSELEDLIGVASYYELSGRENVPDGFYFIVDNAYSSTFGTISGGIDPGQFRIFGIESLGATFDQEIS